VRIRIELGGTDISPPDSFSYHSNFRFRSSFRSRSSFQAVLVYIVHSCVFGVAPVCLQELRVLVSEVAQRLRLHSSTYGDLCVPRVAI